MAEYGGKSAPTPRAAAEGADFVFSCVGNDDDLRSVTIGPGGAFEGMKKGAVYIDNTTASAIVARELDAAAQGCAASAVSMLLSPAGRRAPKTAS